MEFTNAVGGVVQILVLQKNLSFRGFEPRGNPGRVLPNEAEASAIWLSIPRQIRLLRKIFDCFLNLSPKDLVRILSFMD